MAVNGVGAATGDRFYWKVNKGAKLICIWSKDGKTFKHRTFDASEMQIKDGTKIKIEFGQVVKEWTE